MSTRSRSFRSAPEATADARRFVRASLVDSSDVVLEDAVLLADELITNAVRHSETTDPIDVVHHARRRTRPGRGVGHGSGSTPVSCLGRGRARGGWGLELVASLASRWGVESDGTGTMVWFEMDGTASNA